MWSSDVFVDAPKKRRFFIALFGMGGWFGGSG